MLAEPARWTRWYWPAALIVSVAAFVLAPGRWDNHVLAAGTAVLGIPEAWFLTRRQFASTLSDWWWRVIDRTRINPPQHWRAGEAIACLAYLLVAGRACDVLVRDGYWLGGVGIATSVFLLWHLFGRWWR